jgi:uncharacterized protein (DUF1697 family)
MGNGKENGSRFIALLRGINVGGHTMIKMTELKAVFEECGLENVATYINSGNIAFDSPLQKPSMQKPARSKGISVSSPHVGKGSLLESELVSMIEAAIERRFGKPIPVMIREQSVINRILKNNPFDGEFESHKEMHVLFMREEMPLEKQQPLMAQQTTDERFAVRGREIYCHLKLGVADSVLGKGFIDRKLKIAITARNWRTVQKLAEL